MIDLSPNEQHTLKHILKSQGIDQAYKVLVFGSRATGKARKYSDIDLALIGETAVPSRVQALLAEALEESKLPYTVDVVDFSSAGERLQSEIRRHGVEFSLA